jgi:hypothetical protein
MQKPRHCPGLFFDDGAKAVRAMAGFAKPPMDKPARKTKYGIRD